jgi:hypothetical protein
MFALPGLRRAERPRPQPLRAHPGRSAVGPLRGPPPGPGPPVRLRHSKGQTEDHVTKLKLVKRQGYGRAKVDLPRKRLLRAA